MKVRQDGAAEYVRSTPKGYTCHRLGSTLPVHLFYWICEKAILALWAVAEAASDAQRTTTIVAKISVNHQAETTH